MTGETTIGESATGERTAPYRFVALGDSLTEGVGDPGPDGGLRGWADRFAEDLAGRRPGLAYTNLAVRGLTTRAVLDTQLAPAVALAPHLATAIVGMNDLIRPSLDLRAFAADLDRLLAGLAATGATVLTATLPAPAQGEPLPTPLRRRLVKRLDLANALIRRTAAAHGALCLDLARLMPPGTGGWSEDRLHPGPEGHRALALAVRTILDGTPVTALDIVPVAVPGADRPSVAEQVRWARQFLVPWLQRRLHQEGGWTGMLTRLPAYGLTLVNRRR